MRRCRGNRHADGHVRVQIVRASVLHEHRPHVLMARHRGAINQRAAAVEEEYEIDTVEAQKGGKAAMLTTAMVVEERQELDATEAKKGRKAAKQVAAIVLEEEQHEAAQIKKQRTSKVGSVI